MRPAPSPASAASPPVAPLDPNAPPASSDWAKAIGQLMQLKPSATKIVVELGDKSRVIWKK
ncbi:MAG: hypothetical protein D6731_12715 [Planctomycetota bacterium]|nr:MAG: hypothetical protein D6731_12715 [Planctomycetota bacterium]